MTTKQTELTEMTEQKTKKNKKTEQTEQTEQEIQQDTVQRIVTPVDYIGKHKDGVRHRYEIQFDDTNDDDVLYNFIIIEEKLKLHHDYLMDLVLLGKKDDQAAYQPINLTLISESKDDIEEYIEHQPQNQPETSDIIIDDSSNIQVIEGERHTYEQNSPALRGDMPLKITFEDVKEHLAPDNATDSEVKLFIQFCLTNQLDPFANDAYIIKYGSKAASFQVSKDLYLKRADQLPDYRGFEAGIIVFNPKTKTLEEREGSFYIKTAGENLVGAYAIVYREGMKPFRTKISRDEYDKKQFIWADKPATMLRKVAIAQALRDAFPNAYAGLYMQEEMTEQ